MRAIEEHPPRGQLAEQRFHVGDLDPAASRSGQERLSARADRPRAQILPRAPLLIGRAPQMKHRLVPGEDREVISDIRCFEPEPVAVAKQHVDHGAVRHEEPHPVCPDQQLVQRREAIRTRQPLQAQRRREAEAERGVGAHRVVDVHPALELVGIVVGHLVGGDVGPHLQHAGPDVARAGTARRHAQREGRGGGGGQDHRGRELRAATDQRSRHARGDDGPSGRADGPRRAQGGPSI